MRVQCVYGSDFHEMHARLRGQINFLILHQIIPCLADEIAEPRPDMNIKGAAFTVSEKSINRMQIRISLKTSSESHLYTVYYFALYVVLYTKYTNKI